jgi:hypothetical protein
METKFQTSFIPKTNLAPVASTTKRSMGFFSFISTIIFFISVVVAGGAFGWHKYLDTSKAKIKDSLERNIKSFEPQTIDEYYRLNNRIDAAKQLLSKHVAVSYVFDFLSEQTIQSVKFNDFKYDVDSLGIATLTMNGEAKSYNAVAYQSEVFGRERALKTPLFSNLDLDTVGNVTFNFTTKIDPGFITYTRKANKINSNEMGDNIESLPQDYSDESNSPLLVPDTSKTNNVNQNNLK